MPEMYVERCRQCCSRTQARHDPGTRLARQSRTRADDAQRQSTVLSEAAPLISMKQEPLPCCLSEHLLLSSWETRPPVSNACLTIQLGRECGSGRPPGTPLPRDVCHQGALWSPSLYDFPSIGQREVRHHNEAVVQLKAFQDGEKFNQIFHASRLALVGLPRKPRMGALHFAPAALSTNQ